MTRKANYQELERRVKELEKEAFKRKQAEEMLRESEERLSTFVDSSTDFFSIWDSELNPIEINKLGVKFFPGAKKEDLIKAASKAGFKVLKEQLIFSEGFQIEDCFRRD